MRDNGREENEEKAKCTVRLNFKRADRVKNNRRMAGGDKCKLTEEIKPTPKASGTKMASECEARRRGRKKMGVIQPGPASVFWQLFKPVKVFET